MLCEVVVRLAQPEDLQKRRELVRNYFSESFWNTFIFFFLQELTLECCVLSGAVLFIFCGVSASACTLLVPSAAAVVAVAVLIHGLTLAQKHSESINGEILGVVVETQGNLLPSAVGPLPIHLRLNEAHNYKRQSTLYSQIIATVSISEYHGVSRSGWFHSLTVHPQWRRRGLALALTDAARRLSVGRGLQSLECALSHLQNGARRLLQLAGWECRGSYERRLMGAALTLPMLRLGLDLPFP